MILSGTLLILIGTLLFFALKGKSGVSLEPLANLLSQAEDLVKAGKAADAVALYESVPPEHFAENPETKATFEQAYGMALFRLAQVDQQAPTFQTALTMLKNAADGWERLNRKYDQACVLNNLARVLQFAALFDHQPGLAQEALSALNEALKTPAIRKKRSLFAALQLTLGMADYYRFKTSNERADLAQALTRLETIWQYYQNCAETEDTRLTQLYLSICYQEQARLEDPAVNLDKALEFARRTAKADRPDLDPLSAARLWLNLGAIYLTRSTHKEKRRNLVLAYRSIKTAVQRYRPQLFEAEYTKSCIDLCQIYQYFGAADHKPQRFAQALQCIGEALALSSQERAPQQYLACTLTQGSLYAHLAQLAAAQQNLTQAIRIYAETLTFDLVREKPDLLTTVQLKLGILHYQLAELAEPEQNLTSAIIAFKTALRINRFDSGSDYDKALAYLDASLGQLETLPVTAANYRQLITAYQELLQLTDSEDQPEQYARAQAVLGRIFLQAAALAEPLTNYQKALSHLEQAGEIYRRLHQLKLQGAVLVDQGNSLLGLARLAKDETYLEQAVRLFKQAQQIFNHPRHRKDQVRVQIGLGTAYRILAQQQNQLGNLHQSLRALETAFNTINPDQAPAEFETLLFELGLTHSYAVEFTEPKYHLTKAAQCFQRALELSASGKGRDPKQLQFEYALVLIRLADHHQANQNLVTAIELLEALREDYQRHRPLSEQILLLNNLALAYQKLSQVNLAQKKNHLLVSVQILNEALALLPPGHDPLDYAMTQNNLGIAYSCLAKTTDRQANLTKARSMFAKALAIYNSEHFPEEHRKIRGNLEFVSIHAPG